MKRQISVTSYHPHKSQYSEHAQPHFQPSASQTGGISEVVRRRMKDSFYKVKNSSDHDELFCSILITDNPNPPKWTEGKLKKSGVLLLVIHNVPSPLLIHLANLDKEDPIIRIIAKTGEEAAKLPEWMFLRLSRWITDLRMERNLKGVIIQNKTISPNGITEQSSEEFITELFGDLIRGETTIEYLDKRGIIGYNNHRQSDSVIKTETKAPEFLSKKNFKQSVELKTFLKEIKVTESPVPRFNGPHLNNAMSRRGYLQHVQTSVSSHLEDIARNATALNSGLKNRIETLENKLKVANQQVDELNRSKTEIRRLYYLPCSKCKQIREDPNF